MCRYATFPRILNFLQICFEKIENLNCFNSYESEEKMDGGGGGGSGAEWSGVEWSGVEWSGVEWEGIFFNWNKQLCVNISQFSMFE